MGMILCMRRALPEFQTDRQRRSKFEIGKSNYGKFSCFQLASPKTARNVSSNLVCSRVGEDGHWDVKNAIITSDNETSYQVVGLYPFTVYSFRVVATNSMGPSQPSKESYYMVTLREGKRHFFFPFSFILCDAIIYQGRDLES